ncbi:hypothetical protein PtB15_8B47 [Puccinia triticina]|nr:hypothetical protein PtB15_8B47 [Puccinia triticina]
MVPCFILYINSAKWARPQKAMMARLAMRSKSLPPKCMLFIVKSCQSITGGLGFSLATVVLSRQRCNGAQ